MDIGDRIKSRRIELGLSVEDLAERIGKNRATVYRYENGDIEKFPLVTLEPIAKVLRMNPADLIGWEDVVFDESSTGIVDIKTELEGLISKVESADTVILESKTLDASAKALLKSSLENLLISVKLISK